MPREKGVPHMGRTSVGEILDTAIGLFREKGVEEVSVDQICHACGITKPTFYKYIPSKDDILTTYYDQVCDDVMLHFADVYQQDSYYDQFHLFYNMIIDSSLELGSAIVNYMMANNIRHHGRAFDRRERLTQIAIPLIRKGKDAGEFMNPASPEDLYDAVNFAFLGLETKWALRDGAIDWSGDFARVSDAILEAHAPIISDAAGQGEV